MACYLILITCCFCPLETDDLPSIDSDSEIEEENSASKGHTDFLNPAVVSMFYLYIDRVIVHILKCFHINFKYVLGCAEKNIIKRENFG